jgi:hypothetical protein
MKQAIVAGEGFGYDEALRRLKRGALVARSGWNGKSMYLFAALGTENPVSIGQEEMARIHVARAPESLPLTATICMRTAQATIVPGWLCSQTDAMAEDWQEVTLLA